MTDPAPTSRIVLEVHAQLLTSAVECRRDRPWGDLHRLCDIGLRQVGHVAQEHGDSLTRWQLLERVANLDAPTPIALDSRCGQFFQSVLLGAAASAASTSDIERDTVSPPSRRFHVPDSLPALQYAGARFIGDVASHARVATDGAHGCDEARVFGAVPR